MGNSSFEVTTIYENSLRIRKGRLPLGFGNNKRKHFELVVNSDIDF